MKESLLAWQINASDFPRLSSLRDKIIFTIQYGLLAPSTHNTQPWLFDVGERSCKIYRNTTIKLPYADATGRDAFISLGCCAENIVIAAKCFGIFERAVWRGDADNCVAEIFFTEHAAPDSVGDRELLSAIPKRVTVRGMFASTSVESELLSTLRRDAVFPGVEAIFVESREQKQAIAGITARGMRAAHAIRPFRAEMAEWIHPNTGPYYDGIPGYAMNMPTPLSFLLPHIIRNLNMGKPLSIVNYKSIGSAPLVCVLSAAQDEPGHWFHVGAIAERLILRCVAAGLRTSIYVAAVEIESLHKELRTAVNCKYRPQFLFCAGFMKKQVFLPSPRWPFKHFLYEKK